MEFFNEIDINLGQSSTAIITAYDINSLSDQGRFFIQTVEGLENTQMVIETENKIVGAGSYLISTHYPEKNISITLNKTFDNFEEITEFRSSIIQELSQFRDSDITFRRIDKEDTKEETYTGILKALNEWERYGLNVSFRLEFLVLNPEPTFS